MHRGHHTRHYAYNPTYVRLFTDSRAWLNHTRYNKTLCTIFNLPGPAVVVIRLTKQHAFYTGSLFYYNTKTRFMLKPQVLWLNKLQSLFLAQFTLKELRVIPHTSNVKVGHNKTKNYKYTHMLLNIMPASFPMIVQNAHVHTLSTLLC